MRQLSFRSEAVPINGTLKCTRSTGTQSSAAGSAKATTPQMFSSPPPIVSLSTEWTCSKMIRLQAGHLIVDTGMAPISSRQHAGSPQNATVTTGSRTLQKTIRSSPKPSGIKCQALLTHHKKCSCGNASIGQRKHARPVLEIPTSVAGVPIIFGKENASPQWNNPEAEPSVATADGSVTRVNIGQIYSDMQDDNARVARSFTPTDSWDPSYSGLNDYSMAEDDFEIGDARTGMGKYPAFFWATRDGIRGRDFSPAVKSSRPSHSCIY